MCSAGYFALCAILALAFESVNAINCYQCASTNSSNPFQCNEFLTSDIDMVPEPCDAVYGAKYCIKHIGRFEAFALRCYQCTTQEEWKCMDGDLVTSAMQPRNCNHVFEAQYCVKTIGRYGGGIGAKRYCSSLDLGTYCNYVGQPGDKLKYRTCVYTCTGDGCNPASAQLPNGLATISATLLVVYGFLFRR